MVHISELVHTLLVHLRNFTQADIPLPLLVLIHFPEVPQYNVPVLATRQAQVVFDLYTLDRATVPSQSTDLVAREQIPYARLRVV